jgi:hypothetical protein
VGSSPAGCKTTPFIGIDTGPDLLDGSHCGPVSNRFMHRKAPRPVPIANGEYQKLVRNPLNSFPHHLLFREASYGDFFSFSSPLAVILPKPSIDPSPTYNSPWTNSPASNVPQAWANSLGATPPHSRQIVLRLMFVSRCSFAAARCFRIFLSKGSIETKNLLAQGQVCLKLQHERSRGMGLAQGPPLQL